MVKTFVKRLFLVIACLMLIIYSLPFSPLALAQPFFSHSLKLAQTPTPQGVAQPTSPQPTSPQPSPVPSPEASKPSPTPQANAKPASGDKANSGGPYDMKTIREAYKSLYGS